MQVYGGKHFPKGHGLLRDGRRATQLAGFARLLAGAAQRSTDWSRRVIPMTVFHPHRPESWVALGDLASVHAIASGSVAAHRVVAAWRADGCGRPAANSDRR